MPSSLAVALADFAAFEEVQSKAAVSTLLERLDVGVPQSAQPKGQSGVLTRLGLMGLLDAARRRGLRSDVVAELALLVRGAGRYRGAIEELTPIHADPRCAIPFGLVAAKLLLDPASATRIAGGTVRLQPDRRVRAPPSR